MNGALTIGTLDGANIEIAEAVGKDNIFIFGLKADEIQELRYNGYNPNDYIEECRPLKDIIDLIQSNFLSPVDFGLFDPIVRSLTTSDNFFVCADFDKYLKMQEIVSEVYRNKTDWVKKSIINVAKSGKFSSDRTIADYAKDVWNVPFVKR